MLDINSHEVVAAQVAGSYASGINEGRTRTNISIVSNPYFDYSDGENDYWRVPAHISDGDRLRAGDVIIAINTDDEIVGCFLR